MLDKCTVVIQAPEHLVKSYCDRLKPCGLNAEEIKGIVIFISETGHIKVCVDYQNYVSSSHR